MRLMAMLSDTDRQQVDDVVAAVRDALGDDAVACYLCGSATSSGLRPDSDLDLLLVVRSPLGGRVRDVVRAVLPLSGRRNGRRPVELTVVLASAVRPWRYPPEREMQYGEWLDLSSWDGSAPAPWGGPVDPDLAVLLTQVLLDGVALFGPPAAELLDPVPAADLRRAVVEGVPGLLADLADDTRNVLLTLARVLATLRTGRIWWKDAAVLQVRDAVPGELVGLLDLAAAAYRGEVTDDWAPLLPDAERLARSLVAEIERAS